MSLPPSFRATDNKSVLSEREFVEKVIGELLLHEYIVEVASQPYIFTKLLKPSVKYWQSQGKSLPIFLDDGIGAARTYISGKIFSLHTHADLLKSGVLPNESKCAWVPVQEITWPGVSINTFEAKLRLTAKRVDSILTDIDIIVGSRPGFEDS